MKILISGIAGRMGQELLKEIEESDDFIACAGYDKIKCNNRIPVYDNIEKIKEKPDVIIDFSNPSATFNILKYAKENIIPIVIATTGNLIRGEKRRCALRISPAADTIRTYPFPRIREKYLAYPAL